MSYDKINNNACSAGWIIVSCINPDTAEYDVNAMDAALKNRFEEYEIEYDALSFIDHIEASGWDQNVQMFIKSGVWVYKDKIAELENELANKAIDEVLSAD